MNRYENTRYGTNNDSRVMHTSQHGHKRYVPRIITINKLKTIAKSYVPLEQAKVGAIEVATGRSLQDDMVYVKHLAVTYLNKKMCEAAIGGEEYVFLNRNCLTTWNDVLDFTRIVLLALVAKAILLTDMRAHGYTISIKGTNFDNASIFIGWGTQR